MSVLPLDYVTYSSIKGKNMPYSSRTRTTLKISLFLALVVIFLLIKRYEFSSNIFHLNSLLTNTETKSGNDDEPIETSTINSSFDDLEEQLISSTGEIAETQAATYRPLVISGPSGVGKGTLIEKVVEYYNHQVDDVLESHEFEEGSLHNMFGFSVSHTTRNPRPGEEMGIHYHFTSHDEIQKAIDDNKFIEYAEVHGNIYGTSYDSVQNVISSQKICILDIDVQGAKRVKSSMLNPYFIFIAPPSMEILEQRLRGRGTETEEAILKRLGKAMDEVTYGMAQGNFDEIIVNDDLEVSFEQIRHILERWYPVLTKIPSPSYEF